jgi:hypothetical protein
MGPSIRAAPSGRIVATRTSAGKEKGVELYLIDFEEQNFVRYLITRK